MNYSALLDHNLTFRPLTRISGESNHRLLEQMAEHENTHTRTLAYLARHPFANVRIAVSHNPNAPRELIAALAKDENPDVRYALAANPLIDGEVLAVLTEDDNPYVSARAVTTLRRIETSEQDKIRAKLIAC
jgi:hypothetical protein